MTDILTTAANRLAHTLNRPQALHALNTHMCANSEPSPRGERGQRRILMI